MRIILALVLVLVASRGAGAAELAPVALFKGVPGTTDTVRRNAVWIVRGDARLDSLAYARLTGVLDTTPSELPRIVLPAITGGGDGVEYEITSSRNTDDSHWVVTGVRPDDELDTVTLLLPREAGEIRLAARNALGTMTAVRKSGDVYHLRRVLGYPYIGADSPAAGQSTPVEQPPADGTSESRDETPPVQTSSRTSASVEIDLLVVTTASAASEAGGQSLLDQAIETAVASTNAGLVDSLAEPRIVLAGVVPVDYVETNDVVVDFERLQTVGDGHLDDVHSLRDSYRADLVMLIIGLGDEFCGYAGWGTRNGAMAPDFGFSVLTEYCVDTTVFAHEIGHNFGLQHDRFINDSGGIFPYSHGYTAPSESWFTVMAYPDGCNFNCVPVNRWSNPRQQLAGERLGVPPGESNAADNVTSLSMNTAEVADFRARDTGSDAAVRVVSSCLAGRGRIDINVVNDQDASAVYRLELEGQTARQITVEPADWGRLRFTGRPPGNYLTVVKRDGQTIFSSDVTTDCGVVSPTVSTPEVSVINACRFDRGYVIFQMVNPYPSSRPYVIEFGGVANRSTTAAPFGQTVRGTSGRPNGTYDYRVRSGSEIVDSGQLVVSCT